MVYPPGSGSPTLQAMHLRVLAPIVVVAALASGCGGKAQFKDDVASLIHGQCAIGMEQQQDSRLLLEGAGLTIDDACTCAIDLVAQNYSVRDLTLMGDENMDIVFTNAGRICATTLTD